MRGGVLVRVAAAIYCAGEELVNAFHQMQTEDKRRTNFI